MKQKERLGYSQRSQAVQTATIPRLMDGWIGQSTLNLPEHALYTAMRESVPIIDAALDKIVRLTGGFRVECSTEDYQLELDQFVREVRVGSSSTGMRQFVESYFSSLLTYGNAVGEIVLDQDGRNIYALFNTRISDVRVRQGRSPLEIEICASRDGINFAPVAYPELVLFNALNPPPGEIHGVSILRSLPFMSEILLKIFHSVGTNFERIANLRYAVTYKPGNDRLDKVYAKEIATGIAHEWADAMNSQKHGIVKDFVAVGDVDIKVIGADNQMIDTQVPMRQVLEQIVAKLGVPPFMLGLHWSSTERMSAQQADILTSELESYQALLEGAVCKICNLFLHLRGYGATVQVNWDEINLQDEVESANARLVIAQARNLEQQMGGNKNETTENSFR